MTTGESDKHKVVHGRQSDYDLEIDRQAEKFLELKHRLTFFLTTAAIGSIAFTLNFAISTLDQITGHVTRIAFLLAGSTLGLFTVGSALFSLQQEIESYRLHIRNRYLRRTWEQLPAGEKDRWDGLNQRARKLLEAAFLFLFLSVAAQVVFFILFL